jgi:hypothetical protein
MLQKMLQNGELQKTAQMDLICCFLLVLCTKTTQFLNTRVCPVLILLRRFRMGSIQQNPPGKDLSPSDCERIIVGLLVNDIIQVNCRYTAYE